jgi:hypothetical protein
MTAHHDPEIIDLSDGYWGSALLALVLIVSIAFVVASAFPTQTGNSAVPVPWHSQPKAIFLGLLAGLPVGLIAWASAPRRLVIDDQAITLERVIGSRVIQMAHVASVKIVARRSKGRDCRLVTLFLRSGKKVVLPVVESSIDDVYIAICTRLPDRHVDWPRARQNPSSLPRSE